MLNPFKDTNWQPGTKELKSFGRSLTIGFPGLAVVFSLVIYLRTHAWVTWPLWMAGIGAAAGLLFWAVPPIAKPFYLGWYFIACSIGLVVSNVILATIFYGVITPIGLLRRAFGKDPMTRQFDRAAKSYWRPVEKVDDPRHYFRQF